MADQMLQGYSELRAKIAALEGQNFGRSLMSMLADAAVREVKITAPVRTGNLRRTVHKDAITDVSAKVIASADYALFVEEGTAPHEITPNARKALRWAASPGGMRLSGAPTKAAQRGASGGVRFATRVHHPGTKPNPFLERGAAKAMESSGAAAVGAAVVKAWNGAR